jgi:hypothetical protein
VLKILVAVLIALGAIGMAVPTRAATTATATETAPGSRPRREVPEDRYAFANGCYSMQPGPRGPYFFHATDLGRYLLLGPGGYLAMADGSVTTAPAASPDTDWVVDQTDGGFALRLTSPDRPLLIDGATRFTFRTASGCATFPEVDLDVTGPYPRGATSYEEVRGFLDGHLHMMAFEYFGGRAHCGRPWHPYGASVALVDCPDHMVANGSAAVMENLLKTGLPIGTHDPVGWPTFKDWPAPGSLTHEQVYYRWMERAWRGGLRMFVNLFVDNSVLCQIYPLKQNSCDEMDSVRLQNQRIRELERYIDAQSGGPGRGWFRIVTDPFEARRVMNDGRLAVVLGIEISDLFGCRMLNDQPQCTAADIDRQMADVQAMGVRQLEFVNKFDNALSGVAGDGGTLGVVINLANFYDTGHFWAMQSCDPHNTGVHDNDQIVAPGGVANQDQLFGALIKQVTPQPVLPVYSEPPHCNDRGFTDLGRHALGELIKRGMLFDPDHMSVIARQQALDYVEAHHYPGVISSHSWATPDAYPRIYALGGMTTPYAGGANGFVSAWRERKKYAPAGRPCFGIGYGADANGLGSQGGPRGLDAKNPVRYPFAGFGGVSVAKQVSGQRVYDINLDGVAHYGLYPDWIEDLRHLAGDEIIKDMSCGPEAYLEMWERAGGIAPASCQPGAVFDALVPGTPATDILRKVGQPQRRQGTTFSYCLAGGGTRVLALDATGRLVAAAKPVDPLPATGRDSAPWLLAAAALLVLSGFLRVRTGKIRTER